ncbi:MAG: ABC transporter permease [Brevinematales bacterium]|nr:ABC transporter permease [Brevinematales bacterium]
MLEGILFEGLIYSLMVLGVYITFRFLDFPDLTVDGSFPLGASITAYLLISGFNPFLSLIFAFLFGAIAGIITATIHNKLKVPGLLAGILTMTMLYSVNIRILGNRANVSLLKTESIFSVSNFFANNNREIFIIIFLIILIILIKLLIDLFFITDLGLSLRAMGNNEKFIIQLGINPEVLKIVGIALSNGLVALSGSIWAQYQGFSDVGMGQGIIIAGLASVMIGEFFIFSRKNIFLMTLSAIIGSLIYRAIMYFGRFYGYYINITPNDLKLLTGLLIIFSIIISKIKKRDEI